MRIRLAWLVSVLLVLAAGHAAAEIYQYKDDRGRTHYTDSYYEVPEKYRDQLRDISGDLEQSDKLRVVPGAEGKRTGKARAKAGATGRTAEGEREPRTGVTAGLGRAFVYAFALLSGRDPNAPDPLGGVSTGFLIFMALLFLLAGLGIGAGLLISACNIAGERSLPLGHAMLIVFIQGVVGALASGGLNLTLSIVGQPDASLTAVAAGLGLVASTTANAAVLKGMHCETWAGAFKVTLAVLLLVAVLLAPIVYFAA